MAVSDLLAESFRHHQAAMAAVDAEALTALQDLRMDADTREIVAACRDPDTRAAVLAVVRERAAGAKGGTQ